MAYKKCLIILITVLVFGTAGVTSVNAQTDSMLNGTWVPVNIPDEIRSLLLDIHMPIDDLLREMGSSLDEYMSQLSKEILSEELRLNNGNFEDVKNGIVAGRGTYTASNGKLTFRSTHFNGSAIGLLSRWYTIEEAMTLLRTMAASLPESIVNMVNQAILLIETSIALEETPLDYSVTAHTLTTFSSLTGTTVYIRRNQE